MSVYRTIGPLVSFIIHWVIDLFYRKVKISPLCVNTLITVGKSVNGKLLAANDYMNKTLKSI